MLLFATVQSSIGYVLLFVVILAVITYGLANVRSGRAEIGSEVFTAPNRKPYYSDADLENKKLNRALWMAFLVLALVALVIPLYWLNEPSRQAGAKAEIQGTLIKMGSKLYENSSDTNHEGLGCAGCHGTKGEGASAAYAMTDADGRFIKSVSWKGPALDNIMLRYNREQVRYILTYGRPFSPMPAWGVAGGGPLDTQEIEDLISYIETLQISPEEAHKQVTEGLAAEKEAAEKAGHPYKSDGEALFNLGYYADVAGGSYSCGRCHTQGWSYGEKQADGGGAFGPNLTGGDSLRQFPGAVLGLQQQIDFVCQGSVNGKQYGVHGQGSGRMPAFCEKPGYNPNNDAGASQPDVPTQEQGAPGSGMMTRDQVQLIVEYVRSL